MDVDEAPVTQVYALSLSEYFIVTHFLSASRRPTLSCRAEVLRGSSEFAFSFFCIHTNFVFLGRPLLIALRLRLLFHPTKKARLLLLLLLCRAATPVPPENSCSCLMTEAWMRLSLCK